MLTQINKIHIGLQTFVSNLLFIIIKIKMGVFMYKLILIFVLYLQPVLEDEKQANGKLANGKSESNGTLNNTYVTTEFSKAYKACYSNGSTNGFLSQHLVQKSDKKLD